MHRPSLVTTYNSHCIHKRGNSPFALGASLRDIRTAGAALAFLIGQSARCKARSSPTLQAVRSVTATRIGTMVHRSVFRFKSFYSDVVHLPCPGTPRATILLLPGNPGLIGESAL
jgi:hypothetical protein